jgi:hypothetical protein
MHKLLTRRRGAPGAWSISEMLLAPFFPCVHVIHEIPLPEPFTTTPSLAWLIFHLHCFTSCHILFPFLLCFHHFSTKQSPCFPHACPLHVPKMPKDGGFPRCIMGHYMLIKLKNLPKSCLDANHSSNFETLKLNSEVVMSTNIWLEELLGIKSNY